MDSFCDRGHTLTFYPRNQYIVCRFISKDYYPLHAIVLFVFGQLEKESKYEMCYDNLHIGIKLTLDAIEETSSKFVTHGVCRS